MNDIIQGVLVNSTQLAFVEEAYGTLALLENTNEVFRYFVNTMQSVTLYNELEVFGRYLAILKVRNDDRFSVSLANDDRYKAVFIPRLSVIGFFDGILVSYMEQSIAPIVFKISFKVKDDHNLMLILVLTDNREYCHEMDLSS